MRRVGRDNGISLIEHFLAASEIQQEYAEQQKNVWQQFHVYFNQGDAVHDSDEYDEDNEVSLFRSTYNFEKEEADSGPAAAKSPQMNQKLFSKSTVIDSR